MRIAIVHNSEDIIRLFTYLIADLGFNICWTCNTAKEAIKNAANDCPDLLLVQLDLTDMKGSELIQKIMESSPTTIIAINNSVKQKPGDIFDAMSAGALDAFSEPSTENTDSIHELKNKILNISKLHDSLKKIEKEKQASSIKNTPLVAIGSSTGGPAALLTILKQLPEKTNAIWVIIQHMDNQFSQGMAKWLNEQTSINIEIAKDNQVPKIGHVYMAGTNDHLIINKTGRFEYTEDPLDYPYRPSVDEFFKSAVSHWPNKLIGVLLTGMGRDGANGLLSFYNRGMHTIAQDQNSCAVYGMPKAACELKAVTIELDINDIAKNIMENLI
ncbi:MAG: chemotaxis response regulator protein-glutamate methylesterase [endosymbiont of Galathealinum brachiosum]|uniref:protein-glutamate methylesterase n=1 Tax=endosymbiont of Galathealinum brachiosum TaxID=2200906 RepID=A0A370DAA8_9GAMM|nr:MAG: chemotaxis response regulator protein-glutamate methylesterase [endosymbiont of Galathealinum brachiosum]